MYSRCATTSELNENIQKLLTLCNVSGEKIVIPKTSTVVKIAEKIVKDKSTELYLQKVNYSLVQAVKALDQNRLDEWSNKETEKYAERLETENETLKAELEAEKASRAELEAELKAEKDAHMELIKSLVEMCVAIELKRDIALEKSQTKIVAKCFDAQKCDLDKLLQKNGVEILEEKTYNSAESNVVNVVGTEDSALSGTVERVVSPGYRYKNKLLKNKDISVYMAKRL